MPPMFGLMRVWVWGYNHDQQKRVREPRSKYSTVGKKKTIPHKTIQKTHTLIGGGPSGIVLRAPENLDEDRLE